jgi:ankyrin repeat protein
MPIEIQRELLACHEGQIDILETIFHKTKNPLAEEVDGDNGLHLACKGGNGYCIKFLRKNGFNINQVNGDGLLPSELAPKEDIYSLMALDVFDDYELYNEYKYVLEKAIEEQDLSELLAYLPRWPMNLRFYLEESGHYRQGTLIHFLLKDFHKECLKKQIKAICTQYTYSPFFEDEEGNKSAHLMIKAGLDPTQCKSHSLKLKNLQGQTPLHLAAQEDNLVSLSRLIDGYGVAKIDPIDEEGRTPLFYAIQKKKTKNAALLIKKGANLHHKDHLQITPLILACKLGNYPIIRELVKYGADINQKGGLDFISPLTVSFSSKSEEIPLFLIKEGAQIKNFGESQSLAEAAALKGKNSILRLLAAKDQSLTDFNQYGVQPIHLAATKGKIKTLDLFDSLGISLESNVIKNDVEPSTFAKEGASRRYHMATPLHFAAERGTPETVRWLLEHGANPENVTEGGVNILTSLLQNTPGNIKENITLFKEYKLSEDLSKIIPAIRQAIAQDSIESLKLLYDLGLPLHSQLEYGMNGLHYACVSGSLLCTAYFLKGGLDCGTPTESGKLPLELAVANKSVEQFRFLVRETAPDLDMQNQKGETLLHIAVRKGNLGHVAFLIDEGVDFDKQDAQGQTPLFIAAQKGFKKIVSLLMLCGANATLKTTFSSLKPEEIANPEIKKIISEINSLQIQEYPGGTPLHVAVKTQNYLAVKLISRHVDINKQNNDGRTALHELCNQESINKKQLQMLRELLKKAAAINLNDKEGNTPLDIARKMSPHSSLTRFLEKAYGENNDLLDEMNEYSDKGSGAENTVNCSIS